MRINRMTAAILCAAGVFTSQAALSAPMGPVASAPSTMVAASAKDVVEFGVYLPLRNPAALDALLAQLHDKTSPRYQQWLHWHGGFCSHDDSQETSRPGASW